LNGRDGPSREIDALERCGWSELTEAGLHESSLAGQGSSRTALAEALRRYSNRPDLLGPMIDVLRRIVVGDQVDEPGGAESREGCSLRLSDRLSEADVVKMVGRFRAGMAKHKLAAEYGMSLSSVKRLLRRS